MKKIISSVLVCVLLIGTMLVLASCGGPNADPKKAEAALKDEGYTVVLNDGSALGGLGGLALPDGVEATLVAYKDGEYIAVSYYDDKDALNKAWEEADESAEELKEKYEDIVCKKSGKMIYIGTKDAIKAAK